MRWFKYEPTVPCRPSVYGESIFVEHWQRAMREPVRFGDGTENEMFESLMSPLDAQARDAVVASSFICWLGTNVGRSFLEAAKRLLTTAVGEEAYMLVWLSQNRRRAGWNNHRRTIDAILPPDAIDVRALETIEIVLRWLGSFRGQLMIQEAEAEIDLTAAKLREQNQMLARAAWRAAELAKSSDVR